LYKILNMISAVISGDIVASTSLSDDGRLVVADKLMELFEKLANEYHIFGRIIKGDYIECVIPEPENALRIALIIKSFVKSLTLNHHLIADNNKRVKNFLIHGIRLAIGYGPLSRYIPEKGIVDGEAIYLSGRTISEFTSYNKERVVIKQTLHFASANAKLNNEMDALFALVDVLISKASARQCEVLYLKLMNDNENQIASKLNISQSVVNQHSTSIGWNAIEKAVNHFNDVIKNL